MKQAMGARLRYARDRRNKMTQEGLADASKVSQQAISNMEKRNGKASVFLFKLADALEVNPRWLLEGEPHDSWLENPAMVLMGQLNEIYSQLDQDRRDSLLGQANRMLSEQKKTPGRHDPFHAAKGKPKPGKKTA